MKTKAFTIKKAGFLSKIVVSCLLIYIVYMLVSIYGQISNTREEIVSLEQQVDAQVQRNAELEDAIVNSDDPTQKMDIAREQLGLTSPGEKVYHFTE